MKVLHLSDIHYRKAYLSKNPYEEMLSSMDSSFTRLQSVVTNVMTQFNIDVIVITGDLCDDGSIEDYTFLKSYFDTLGNPVYVCLGNHDISENFYQGWCCENSNQPYLRTHENQMSWVCFDNSKHGYANGYIDSKRLTWLEEQLKVHKNCIVMMHHQFDDVPGTPGLENKYLLQDVLMKYPPVAVFNGHTHWFKTGKIGNIPYFTAPSVSFRAVNEPDGTVIFSQSQGYCVYEVNAEGVYLMKENEVEGKQLSIWR